MSDPHRDDHGSRGEGYGCPCKGQLTADNPQGAVCIKPTWQSKREAAGLHPLIAVDYCMVPETLELWNAGVITGAVCCRHGLLPGFISVVSADSANTMLDLGYKVADVSDEEGVFNFKPKTPTPTPPQSEQPGGEAKRNG